MVPIFLRPWLEVLTSILLFWETRYTWVGINQEETKCKELVMHDCENKYIECSARNDKSTMVALNIANARNKQHGFPIKWQCTEWKSHQILSPRFQRSLHCQRSAAVSVQEWRNQRCKTRNSVKGVFNQLSNCWNPFGASTNF